MVHSQKRVTTFGLQIKPIVPSNLFNTGETALTKNNLDFAVNQKLGYSMGGIIRIGLNERFSMETGISLVKRHFEATVFDNLDAYADTTRFGIYGYEVPVLGMVFIRLTDQIYMNTAFGLAFDVFPSDVSSLGSSDEFEHVGIRRGLNETTNLLSWMKVGLIANLGYEFRTEKSGYFYVGGSYHLPFQNIYHSFLLYERNAISDQAHLQLAGNYLTLDFRYLFHEEPKEKKRKTKRDPDSMPGWMKK
jgi:hypothetical protein